MSDIVVLVSDDGCHTGRTGYPLVFDYLTNEVRIVSVRRTSPRGLRRILAALLKWHAASGWYAPSSALLEWIGFWEDCSMLHLAWADRDWGYLDLVLNGHRPLICTFHACPDDFAGTVAHPCRLKNLAAAILMSEVQRVNFEKAGMLRGRIHVIHHGIDTKYFLPANQKKAPSDVLTVLHVGSYRRNFDDLEAVCDKLRNSPNIQIKIVTSPKVGSRFANKPNVEVKSGLSDAELLKAYQDADCLLMTAEAATANNAILEGIACGLPVVTQRVGGIPEYVNEECAFLCEPGDTDALVNALERLQADAALRVQMGQAARARALELDWVHVAAKTQAVYDLVVAERHQ